MGPRRLHSLPVIGFVSVAVNLKGKTYYMQKVHVVEGLDGGVWSPCKMKYAGFDAHINYNRGEMTPAPTPGSPPLPAAS